MLTHSSIIEAGAQVIVYVPVSKTNPRFVGCGIPSPINPLSVDIHRMRGGSDLSALCRRFALLPSVLIELTDILRK